MKSPLTAITVTFLLWTAAGGAQTVESRLQSHVERALAGGLQADDFHHLFICSTWRSTISRWSLMHELVDKLATADPIDPLMADELRLLSARLAVDEGRQADARALFTTMGGLDSWWAAGPIAVDELEDFPVRASFPTADTEWRPAPGSDPLGWVRLAGLAWPARRQMLYLATTVESQRLQAVAVRLGAAQSARLWINGGEVLTTPRPLSHAEDQMTAGAWLEEGRNTVVVAVASESDDWWLRVRLTAPDGSRLGGVRELEQAPTPRNAELRQPPTVGSLEEELRRAAARGKGESQLALAAYLVARRPQPVAASDAQVACREARAQAPAEARLLEWLISSEPGAARTLLEDALADDPGLHWARVELIRWYHQRELYAEAEELADAAKTVPLVRAAILDLDAARWGPLVLPELATLADASPSSPEILSALAGRAIDGARWPLAHRALDRLQQSTPGLEVTRRLTEEIAIRCGDSPQLIRILDRGLDADPNDAELRVRLARLLAAEKRDQDAVALLEEGLARCPDHGQLLLELARLEHARGADERAVVLARRLLELRPQDRRAERLLELLGDSDPVKAWTRDADELRQLAAAAAPASPASGLVNHVELHFLPSNLTEERVQRAFLITDADRADFLRAHPLAYVPERQRLRVLTARILRADGSELSAVQNDTPRLSEPEINIFYDTRLRVLHFTELENGDIIDISYVLTETAEANETGPYKGGLLRLGSRVPMQVVEVEMHAPEELLPTWQLALLEGQPERRNEADGSTVLSWRWTDLPAIARDVPAAPDLLVNPHLTYSNHSSWGDLAEWYAKHVAPRIRPSRLVEQTAAELTDGVEDRLQRIARIYRFVTDDVRYVGLEFGEHRFRPFPADWVLNHRIGDCKDKAALLVALLRAVDIPAVMVMVRIADEGPVANSIAVLEVFNHAIAYLPEDDLWLDGTATGHDPYPPPTMDQGAWVLAVMGPDSHPQTTPMPGGGMSRYGYEVSRGAGPELELAIHTVDTGEAADSRRAMFSGTKDPRRYAAWLQSQFPGSDLVGEPQVDMRPGRKAATMQLTATVSRGAVLSRGGLPAFPGEFDWAAQLVPTGSRSGPLLLPVRPKLEWTVAVDLGRPPAKLPDNVELSTRFGSLSLRFTDDDEGYRVAGSFQLVPGLVDAAAAAELRAFLLEVQQHLSDTLEVP